MHGRRKQPERSRPVWPIFVAFALASGLSGAQEDVTAKGLATTDPAELTRAIVAEEEQVRTRTLNLMRFRASYPQLVSASFGVMRTKEPVSYECQTVCQFKGMTFQIEPGIGGTQASLGYAHLIGETRRSKRLMKAVYVGMGGKAVVMRTYGESPLTPAAQTLVGAEGSFTVASANFSLAVLRSLTDERSRDWIVSFGIGWGF